MRGLKVKKPIVSSQTPLLPNLYVNRVQVVSRLLNNVLKKRDSLILGWLGYGKTSLLFALAAKFMEFNFRVKYVVSGKLSDVGNLLKSGVYDVILVDDVELLDDVDKSSETILIIASEPSVRTKADIIKKLKLDVVKLDLLTKEDLKLFFSKLSNLTDVKITNDFIDYIYELTNGYPHTIVAIIEYLTKEIRCLTRQVLNRKLNEILDYLASTPNPLTERVLSLNKTERLTLLAVAKRGEATVEEIYRELPRVTISREIKLTLRSLRRILAKLSELELIQIRRKNRYSVNPPILGELLRTRYSVIVSKYRKSKYSI